MDFHPKLTGSFVSCSAYIALVATKPKSECRLIKFHIPFYTTAGSSYVTGPAKKGVFFFLIFFSFCVLGKNTWKIVI